jgi:hypothetical protein
LLARLLQNHFHFFFVLSFQNLTHINDFFIKNNNPVSLMHEKIIMFMMGHYDNEVEQPVKAIETLTVSCPYNGGGWNNQSYS